MDNKSLFYQESGKINFLGLLFSVIIYGLVAMILGYVYSALIAFIPFIYINFFITIGVGIALGFMVRLLVRITHNRNKRSKIILAIVFGLLFNFFQWIVYILNIANGELPDISYYLESFVWFANPKNFFGAIATINSVGAWAIFGTTFTGIPLALVWIIEAFIIIGLPVMAIYKTKTYPYSEFLNKWYPKYTLLKDFESVSTVNKMIRDLQKDPLKSIQDLKYGSGSRHTKIHVFYLKNEKYQYLTFENIFIEKRGEGKRHSEIIINNYRIDKRTAELIRDNFKNKRERIELI